MAKYVQPNFIVDSSAAFLRNVTFDSSVYLKGVTHISSPGATTANTPYALVVGTLGTDVSIQSRQLGTMAWESSTNYYGKTQTDVLFGLRDTSIAFLDNQRKQLDASIVRIDAYQGVQDSSIAAALAGTTQAWNGVTRTDNSIGLGGSLDLPTTITTGATNTLTLAGLQTGTSRLAVISNGGVLQTQQLGTMALETSTNYVDHAFLNASLGTVWTKFGNVDTSLNGIWTKFSSVDTSLTNLGIKDAAQDVSLNGIWTKFGSVDTSLTNLGVKDAAQDVSLNAIWTEIGNINSSQGLYVLKSGDTMTGLLTLQAGEVISSGGLSLTTGDISIMNGALYVKNNTYIGGNLTVDGSFFVTNVESIDVSAAFIFLNTGLTGPPPAYMQSGIVVDRGNQNPYVFVYDEDDQTFRVGIATADASGIYNDASTEAVATREDAPVTFGVPFWNSSKFRFDTSIGFIFTPGVGLSLPIATTDNSATTALFRVGSLIKSRTLGTNAFDSSVYVLQTQFDSSLAVIISAINDLSTGKIDAVASTTSVVGGHQVYSGEANNVAYIKQIIAGSGATITDDASTITIAVSGAAGYVSKYKGTFDGTAAGPFTISAGTHGLGTGPLQVAVYESNEQVYTGVQCDGAGLVTLSWGPGSLTDASCKFIITG